MGHYDGQYDQKLFKARYKNLLEALMDKIPKAKILFTSLINFNKGQQWANILQRSSFLLKTASDSDQDMKGKFFYVDIDNKLQQWGCIPPEFIRENGLNLTGIKQFFHLLRHKLCGLHCLWPEKPGNVFEL